MKWLLVTIMLLMPVASSAQSLWSSHQDQVVIDQGMMDLVMDKRVQQFSLSVAGKEHQVQVKTVSDPNLGVISIQGQINDNPDSFFLLCRTDTGAVAAFFQSGDGSAYRLNRRDGYEEIQSVDELNLGPCAGAIKPESDWAPTGIPAARPLVLDDKTRSVADDGSRHDILVAYTPRAETIMGGWDFIRAEAQLAVDAANLTYNNSSITSNLRLVHVMATIYDEETAVLYEDHLHSLWNPNDGIMDDVMIKRDLVGADFVSVLVDGLDVGEGVATCGVGYVMQSHQINSDFEDLALSVVSVQCATVSWSLAHEIGHNRGCAHNRNDASVLGAYPYSYGRRFVGDGDAWYRTVMAYDHFLGGYERIPYFTNPDVNYGGVPTGVSPGLEGEAHNTLTHNNTAALCAAFRGERTFVEFGWSGAIPDGFVLTPFPTLLEAVGGSLAGGTIVIQNSKPDFVGTLDGPRAYVHGGTGSAVLGGL